jgi:rubrerythrin
MFKNIVALNTYTEPFLSMKSGEQREIIEQLLGITLLSEKAEALKELIRLTKETIMQENANIEATKKSNDTIQQSIESLERRQQLWLQKHDADIKEIETTLEELGKIDIDAEIQAHKDLAAYNQKRKDIADINGAVARAEADHTRETNALKKLLVEIEKLQDHSCHACGQQLHDEKHDQLLVNKVKNKE